MEIYFLIGMQVPVWIFLRFEKQMWSFKPCWLSLQLSRISKLPPNWQSYFLLVIAPIYQNKIKVFHTCDKQCYMLNSFFDLFSIYHSCSDTMVWTGEFNPVSMNHRMGRNACVYQAFELIVSCVSMY